MRHLRSPRSIAKRQHQALFVAVALLVLSSTLTPAAFAFGWDSLNPLPNKAEKARKKAKQAELQAKDAKYRAEYAEKEAARLKLEAAEAEKKADLAKQQLIPTGSTPKYEVKSETSELEATQAETKLQETAKNEPPVVKPSKKRRQASADVLSEAHEGADESSAKAYEQEQSAIQHEKAQAEAEYVEDVTSQGETATSKTVAETGTATDSGFSKNQVQKDVPVQKKRSIWNPMSWMGGAKDNAAQVADKPRVMMVQSAAIGAAVGNAQPETPDVQITPVVDLPEGVNEADAKYYQDARKYRAAMIETEHGNIAIELYTDAAPVTVTNFVKLTELGFYNQNGMKFHRVVPGFVVQTGDPTGTGAGGSKDRIPLEVKNKLSHDGIGVVAMARGASVNSATSQFYITLAPQKTLDAKYAIFGRVLNGYEALEKIEKDDRMYGVKLVDVNTVTKEDPNENKKQSFLKKLF